MAGAMQFADPDEEMDPAIPKPVGDRNLDSFFAQKDNASTMAGSDTASVSSVTSAPPPPNFVDKRDYTSSTPGGFGNTPASSSTSQPDSTGAFFMQNATVLGNALGGFISSNAVASEVTKVAKDKWTSHVGETLSIWTMFSYRVCTRKVYMSESELRSNKIVGPFLLHVASTPG